MVGADTSGIIKEIQAEDRAIRERGQVRTPDLVRELLLFFGIQVFVLASIVLFHLYD